MSNPHSLRRFFQILGRSATRAPLAGQVLFTTHDRDAARHNADLAALVDCDRDPEYGDDPRRSGHVHPRPALAPRTSAC